MDNLEAWLKVGSKATVEMEHNFFEVTYNSEINQIEANFIGILLPEHDGKAPAFKLNEQVRVGVSGGDAEYSFESKVLGQIGQPIPMLKITHPKKVDRKQRRDYLRIPLDLPCNVVGPTKQGGRRTIKGTMIDLSGGGGLVEVPGGEDLPDEGGRVTVEFSLPGNRKEYWFRSKICRKLQDPVRIGLEFLEMKDEDQVAIVQFVFAQQRAISKE